MEELRDYGKRWLVEVVFSSFKRVLGDAQVEEVPQPEGRGVPQGHAVQQVPVNQAVDDGTRIGAASQSSITAGLSYRLMIMGTLIH